MTSLVDSNKTWDLVDSDLIEYNSRQYKTKYRSTDFVISCLKEEIEESNEYKILDVGCGGGGNLYHIAKQFVNCSFTGIDLNNFFINYAKEQHKLNNVQNTKFKHLNFNDFTNEEYDIIGSTQFLEVLDLNKAEKFKHKCFQMATRGVYFQALFTNRLLDYEINIHDYKYNKIVPYNIFSIEKMKEIASSYNFVLKQKKEFIIDVDLLDTHEGRGTYTIKKQTGERMMFTDILNLPWYFLYFQK